MMAAQMLKVSMPSITTDWISSTEAMAIMRCGEKTLYRLRKSGQIRSNATGIKGKPILYSLKSINNYISNKGKLIKL